jgi:hypothetical protein
VTRRPVFSARAKHQDHDQTYRRRIDDHEEHPTKANIMQQGKRNSWLIAAAIRLIDYAPDVRVERDFLGNISAI